MQPQPGSSDVQLGIQGRQVVYRRTTSEQDNSEVSLIPKRASRVSPSRPKSIQVGKVNSALIEESDYPLSIVGLPTSVALASIPRLPDQDSSVLLWMLLSTWIGGSSMSIAPKAVLGSVLRGVKKVLNLQLAYPNGWGGLPPELTCPVTTKLCLEFGPIEFIRAVLGVSSLYILLHHDSNVRSLYPMLQELEDAFIQWTAALGARYEFLPWREPEAER